MSNRMNLLIFLIGLACIIQTGLAQLDVLQGQQCYAPDNHIGQCLTLSNCPSIANVLNFYPRNDAVRYLQIAEQNCGNNNFRGDPVVCCCFNHEYITTTRASSPFFGTNTQPVGAPAIFANPPTIPAPAPSLTVGSECTGPDFNPGTRQQCYTPENGIGQCLTLSNCPSIANLFNIYPRDDAVRYLQIAERNCGNNNFRGDPVEIHLYQTYTPPTALAPPILIDQPPTTTTSTTSAPAPSTTEGVTKQEGIVGSECSGPGVEPGACIPITPRNTFSPTNTPPTTLAPSIIIDPPTTTTTTTPAPVPSTTEAVTNPYSKIGSECITRDFELGTCTRGMCVECKANCGQMYGCRKSGLKSSVLCQNCSEETCENITIRDLLDDIDDICDDDNSLIESTYDMSRTNLNENFEDTRTFWEKSPVFKDRMMEVVDGEMSRVGAWPWIAMIGYDDGVSPSSFKCGGALITSRHVLTAAHCVRSDLSFVRLGESDLSTIYETSHVDVPVVKNLRHPRYNKTDGHNDIALLYLGQNVEFSGRIKPICLPFEPSLRSKNITGLNPFVAGWDRAMEGGNSSTDVLQELEIKVFDNEVCKDNYKKLGKFVSEEQFDSAVICAGDLSSGNDTCHGDSGGPLMLSEDSEFPKHFYLIGIASHGIGCRRPDIPGVYTRVTNYIEWIENGVADTP